MTLAAPRPSRAREGAGRLRQRALGRASESHFSLFR